MWRCGGASTFHWPTPNPTPKEIEFIFSLMPQVARKMLMV